VRRRPDPRDDVFPGQPTIRVLYALPRGRPNRLVYFARLLQANITTIQRFVATQSGDRKTVRFDMGTRCGPQYVDISLLRLKRRTGAYLEPAGGQLIPTIDPGTRLQREIRRATRRDRRDNYLVYVDGLNHASATDPVPTAGMTDVVVPDSRPGPVNANNGGGRIGAVFGPDQGLPPLRAEGFDSKMFVHELLHTLGAVQDNAPHATGGGHCYDGADIMCYADGGPRSARYSSSYCSTLTSVIPQVIDCSRDDYFNPSPNPGSYLATHWNVYDSAFLGSCTDAQLRAACGPAQPAAGVASAAGAPAPAAGTGAPASTVTAPIVTDTGGASVGSMTATLALGATDAKLETSGSSLSLAPGRYRIETCLGVAYAGAPPWSTCSSVPGYGGGVDIAPRQSTTMTRPNGPGSYATATVNVYAIDPSGSETRIASGTVSGPAELPLPAR
jgi:hypothetical protein